jgi:hypothetical protein
MVMALCNGVMVLSLKVNGQWGRLKAMVYLHIQREKSMMVNGFTIKLMVEAFTFILMVLSTMANGNMICNMVWEKRLGLMDHDS